MDGATGSVMKVSSLAYGCPNLRALDLCGCLRITGINAHHLHEFYVVIFNELEFVLKHDLREGRLLLQALDLVTYMLQTRVDVLRPCFG